MSDETDSTEENKPLFDPLSMQVDGGSDRLGAVLPKRPFGRSGELVTNLGVGGWHIGNADGERTAQEIIERALEEGIRFFDTAPSYQDGRSEYRYGNYLVPRYRDDVFLMTKTKARSGVEATAEIDASLARMKTDHLDGVLMHAMSTEEDPAERLDLGVFEAFQKAKEQGKVRYIGFSGHFYTKANLKALELFGEEVDMSLMPINAIDPSDDDSFIHDVLPVLQKMGVAPLAMKTAAYGHFFTKAVEIEGLDTVPLVPGRISMEDAFQFVLSNPISCWVSGMDKPEFVPCNAKIAREFKGMEESRRNEIIARVEAYRNNKEVEIYRRWG